MKFRNTYIYIYIYIYIYYFVVNILKITLFFHDLGLFCLYIIKYCYWLHTIKCFQELVLYIGLRPVKIGNAPMQITGVSAQEISEYNLDRGRIEWVDCDVPKKVDVELLYNSV